jgi:hypothetical protein
MIGGWTWDVAGAWIPLAADLGDIGAMSCTM